MSTRGFTSSATRPKNTLTHLTPQSEVHMVQLPTSKPSTQRTATARCMVHFSNKLAAEALRTATLAKGDALAVARVAGIMAAKRTADLIPLCHNIPLSGVEVAVQVVDEEVGYGGVSVEATVRTNGQTGVEMEALVAANVAALTVYDMCKALDKGMTVDGLRVVLKEGGKSGTWVDGRRVEDGEGPSG